MVTCKEESNKVQCCPLLCALSMWNLITGLAALP